MSLNHLELVRKEITREIRDTISIVILFRRFDKKLASPSVPSSSVQAWHSDPSLPSTLGLLLLCFRVGRKIEKNESWIQNVSYFVSSIAFNI